jgi:selenide,water dikinase
MVEVGVSACTDVTGFGFLGHLYEMVKHSGVSALVYSDRLQFVEGALEFASMGLLPAATYENESFVGNAVEFSESVDRDLRALLFDPQTSGGLLIAVPEEKKELLVKRLKEEKHPWVYEVGKIEEGAGIKVV